MAKEKSVNKRNLSEVITDKVKNFDIKKVVIDKEKFWINFFVVVAFLSIFIGLIIFLVFFIKVGKHYSITADNIEFDKTGQVGDFIGGIVGSIWSLTGVLLFYATLRLQGKELRESRIHFQLSRLTEIIYKQLDMFNKHMDNFVLIDIEKDVSGHPLRSQGKSAVTLITKRVHKVLDINKIPDVSKKNEELIKYATENFAFIELNKQEFLNIYTELDNQIDTIRAVLIKDDIPPADLNELKAIFFRNIGTEFLNSSENILSLVESYLNVLRKKEGFNELFSIEGSIKSKLATIKEFRHKHYDKTTIKNYLAGRDMYNITSF